MTGTHGDGYRGCQSKTTTGVACAKWAGQILKTDGTSCASGGLADLSYDDCWALRWKQPDGWIPDAKGNKLDSRYIRYFSAHWRNLPRLPDLLLPARAQWNHVIFNLANKGGRRQQGGRDLADLPQRLVRQVVLAQVCSCRSTRKRASANTTSVATRPPTPASGATDAMN